MNKHEHATTVRSPRPGDSTFTKKWTVSCFLSAKMKHREIVKKSIELPFQVEASVKKQNK